MDYIKFFEYQKEVEILQEEIENEKYENYLNICRQIQSLYAEKNFYIMNY
jgi:hypothetical protein